MSTAALTPRAGGRGPAARRRAPGRRATALAGTRSLLRTTIRHDARLMGPWVLIVTALSASSVLVYPWVFPTQESRLALTATIGANPAVGLVFGPARDLTTADGFNAWRVLAIGGFLAALCAIFAVTRATRAQEDSGRAELLASGVLGRSSRLLVGVVLALTGTLVLGLVAGLLTVPFGGTWEASMLLGATFTATAWMSAGVAAVTAQLGADARSANSMAVGTLGAAFILRGFTYAVDAPSWTTWANPLGWMTETQPATGDHWWPLALALGLTAVLLAVAFTLQSRRDFGQGLVAQRPGPARGRARTPWGLALRVNAGPLASWAVASVMLGVIFGYLSTSMTDLLTADRAAASVLAAGAATPEEVVGRFLTTILALLGILVAIPGVQVLLRVRSEETEDRLEPVIATAVRRRRYLAAQVVLALGSTALFMLVAGGIVALLAAGADIGVELGDVAVQAVITVPAVWTVVALSVAVVGARPAAALASWAGVLASFLLTLLGPTFDLDDWVLGISPFWHVPEVAAGTLAWSQVDWSGLGWISLVTLGFLVVGFVGFRRRDLAR